MFDLHGRLRGGGGVFVSAHFGCRDCVVIINHDEYQPCLGLRVLMWGLFGLFMFDRPCLCFVLWDYGGSACLGRYETLRRMVPYLDTTVVLRFQALIVARITHQSVKSI
jgi:hypothetical protein